MAAKDRHTGPFKGFGEVGADRLHQILGVISDFSEDDVKGATGRDKLAAALRDAINGKLEVLENFGGVEEVMFTEFVVQ